MDTLLLTVTGLSLAMAVAMAFVVRKLMRDERARSEARVSSLTAIAGHGDGGVELPDFLNETSSIEPRDVAPSRVTPLTPPAPRFDDLDIRGDSPAIAGVSHLFEEADAPSPWGRRFAVIGTLAAVVMIVALILSATHNRAIATQTTAATPGQPAVLDSAPLELMSLRHTQEPQRLVITGLVQNPRNGAPISHVVATAFLFGADGAFLTSSRAPLDFTTLSPGDESSFVINVPVTGQVARYRISFRTDDGRVIEHVDKRAPDAIARN